MNRSPASARGREAHVLAPAGKDVVACCRVPFCVMSEEAVELLRKRGYSAHRIIDGATEWQAGGLPVER